MLIDGSKIPNSLVTDIITFFDKNFSGGYDLVTAQRNAPKTSVRVSGIFGTISGILMIIATSTLNTILDMLSKASEIMDEISSALDKNDYSTAVDLASSLKTYGSKIVGLSGNLWIYLLFAAIFLIIFSIGFFSLKELKGSAIGTGVLLIISSIFIIFYGLTLSGALYSFGKSLSSAADVVINGDFDAWVDAVSGIVAAEIALQGAQIFSFVLIILLLITSILALITLRKYGKISLVGAIFMIIGSLLWMARAFASVFGLGIILVGIDFMRKG